MTKRTRTEMTDAQKIADLQRKLTASIKRAEVAEAAKGSGRAEEALEVIKANPIFTNKLLADAMKIESKNVSSILNALKKRLHRWVKDADNFIYIGKMNDEAWKAYVSSLVAVIEKKKTA